MINTSIELFFSSNNSLADSLEYGWKINSSNVGLAGVGIDGNSLEVYTGSSTPANGTVISLKLIQSGLDLSNGNITLDRCYIKPTVNGSGMHIIRSDDQTKPNYLYDCDIDATGISVPAQRTYGAGYAGSGIIERCKLWGMGSGIYLRGGIGITSIARNNYVFGLTWWSDSHSDGFTIRDFTGVQCLVTGNRFMCNSGADSGSCFIQTQAGNIDNVLITKNLLEGNGWNLGLNQDTNRFPDYSYGSNLKVINNRFQDFGGGAYFGAGYVQGGIGWADKSENYTNNPSSPPENKGTLVDLGQ